MDSGSRQHPPLLPKAFQPHAIFRSFSPLLPHLKHCGWGALAQPQHRAGGTKEGWAGQGVCRPVLQVDAFYERYLDVKNSLKGTCG